ncbi:PDGLE domain-containing protein|uniref:Cobalt/nickel transport system permease protein n=1 Tax=Dendrosporobacter quercicolus TaxID=146817 RepID=A0A1G9TZ50_9FIRM|nr:energy-coupling factor ABC transporter permease [Dendrosporobacter quercicolus]NSL48809.1 PDGLE domain-containing protein [Dendrosporobacter quercicolus DSM 1736]SDM52863.1 cobalt/nickel transport system permease protein [Dendrosporobacter quercicolus]
MHMADALISPVAGGAMWAVTAGLTVYAANRVKQEPDEQKIPLMGVLGAFVFAAQMINFTIPGTGSSGHIGGGLLLAILLGPHAAFLTIASILAVQALLFADGGLLALGCNIFNMGFIPCYIAYPFIYQPLAGSSPSPGRLTRGSVAAAVISLQLGAFSVVLQTLVSGITELPFSAFALLMQPIHLAIGLIEGLVIAAVVGFVYRQSPDILAGNDRPLATAPARKVLLVLLILTVVAAGALSWFASVNPDGLEWSITATSGLEELTATNAVHGYLAEVQQTIAFLPDYNFKPGDVVAEPAAVQPEQTAWPSVDAGKSVAGITGSLITLILALTIGKVLRLAAKH